MRATDRSRSRTIAHLRDGYASGALHTETFARRVDEALAATTDERLDGLTSDVPAVPGRFSRVRRLLGTPADGPPSLLDPAVLRDGRIVLGRAPSCGLRFADDTVSREHAELVLDAGHWFLRDLGSCNGTWVNGRRVFDAEVVPGDEVRLGELVFRL
jgi:hypothetical protein